jgi:hypothetical protein
MHLHAIAIHSASDFWFLVVTIVTALGITWLLQVRSRKRFRGLHAEAAVTGIGIWAGRVGLDNLESLTGFQLGFWKSWMLEGGVPVRLETTSYGLALTPTGWPVKNNEQLSLEVPWSDVVDATSEAAGYRQYDGKISTVPMTEIFVTLTGQSAESFLDPWSWEEEDEVSTPEDEAEWWEDVKDFLGPHWQPGTALLTFRTSAPDSMVESITRWARGTPPPGK